MLKEFIKASIFCVVAAMVVYAVATALHGALAYFALQLLLWGAAG